MLYELKPIYCYMSIIPQLKKNKKEYLCVRRAHICKESFPVEERISEFENRSIGNTQISPKGGRN